MPSSLLGSGFFNLNTFVMEKEIWKPVKGFEGYYSVSNYGRLISLRSGKILSAYENNKGYLYYTFNVNKKQKRRTVQKTVAEAFLKNSDNKPFVNHKDLDKKNNFYKNLEWCTHKENIYHAKINGALDNCYGNNRGNSPHLGMSKAKKIREEYNDGGVTMISLSEKYGVSYSTIKNLIAGRTY